MRKLLRKKLNNEGNTFIVFMVTLACMGILVGVILATVGYYQRMRYVDLKNKNNFYYAEKAMDEIYTGVGNDSVQYLVSAYSDTVEVLLYYGKDKITGEYRYMSIDPEQANQIMKQKFLEKMATNADYKSQAKLYEHLKAFISTPDVELVDPATLAATEPRLFMEVVTSTKGVGPKATKTYDKLVIHNVTVKHTTADGYTQSITTDITISEPEFNVAFSNVDAAVNSLYNFSMIADMGIEFNQATKGNQVVTIAGDVYAASDYYNKDYNTKAATRVSSHNSDADLDGTTDSSRYSGFYANESNVSVMAEKFIIPGSISLVNDSSVSIAGNSVAGDANAEVWTDNIILTPASTRTMGVSNSGGSLTMYANAHVADDLEVNNDDAEVTLSGNYYGYNFSQTSASQRTLSEYASSGRKHYDSSAIIVNGNDANLDFTGLKDLWVAGRAYIETTRQQQVTTSEDGKTATTSYITYSDNEDVRTGESISVKSNQLAYVPYGIEEQKAGGNVVAKKPIFSKVYPAFNNYIYIQLTSHGWVDIGDEVVENTVSDKTYYYLKFTSATAAAEFFDWYANELPKEPGYEQATDLANIRQYSDFNVKGINITESGSNITKVTTSGAYTTGALNVANNKFLKVSVPNYAKGTSLIDGENESTTIADISSKATQYNEDYNEMKYALQTIDLSLYTGDLLTEMTAMKDTIKSTDAKDITPINQYLDFSKLNGMDLNGVKLGNYYVWISDKDVTVKAPTGTSGKVMGIILTKGNVTFDSDVKRFEGLIVSGSKIQVDHPMDFVANAEIVKTVLATADASKGDADDYSEICKIFKDYSATSTTTEDKSVGSIEIGDVLQYNNWKKNVE